MDRAATDDLTHLRFLENMERVERAIRSADDLEQMLKDVLDTILSIFGADRAFLLHPVDPDAEFFSVPMESARPEYPGALERGFELFSVPSLQALSRDLLDSDGPMSMGGGSDKPIPPEQQKQFSIKSMLCMPIFPKVGPPWAVGIHQCSREREWTKEDRQLFQEIGRRVADSLSSFITLRDLRQSEEKYRSFFQWSADSMILLDGDTFVDCNDAVARMFGYRDREAVLEMHPWDLSPEFQPDGISSRDKSAQLLSRLSRERSVRFEWLHKRADGEIFPAEVVLTYITIGDKNLAHGVIRDLTELKSAEEALRQGEEKYRALFEWSADPTLLIDGDTFINCNDAAVRMLRYNNKEELLQTHPWELSPEFQPNGRTSKEKAEEILASMPIERSRRFEWTHRRADGELFPAEVLLTYIPVGDKHLINTVWRDLTELKKAEKEARHLRNLLTNIVNSMPSVLIGVDVDASVMQWNRMAQHVTGIAPEDAQGKDLASVFPQLAGQLEHVRQAIAKGESRSESKIPATVDGETHFSDITIYPLISNGTEGAVIRIDDVTERVRVEEMMIQSEKMLSVGGLAAGMAHEINNPLAGILQSVQVILDRISPDMPANQKVADEYGISLSALNEYMQSRKIIDLLGGVHASGRRAARIVDNMLSFSRKSSTEYGKKNLVEIIDRTVELAANDYIAKRDFQFRDIKITRRYSSNLPDVPCEETEIQQVVLNLLKNAAQAMVDRDEPHAPPALTISIAPDEDMVKIEIQDNGPGMSEAVRRRVFEPFYTTKSVGVGTGLGLSVSYFIITEKHQGTLSVESALEKGTNFIIRLPMERTNIRRASVGAGGEGMGYVE
ncbi:MAG: PAS domain S-box protein [Pirellulales bacterium]|nr:PAS domain S-box protein [Pirellulales bacterium]